MQTAIKQGKRTLKMLEEMRLSMIEDESFTVGDCLEIGEIITKQVEIVKKLEELKC